MTENKDIFKLIPKIMNECGSIGKNKKNIGQGYKFRGIDDVYLALQKLLAQNGVFCVPKVLDVLREKKQSKNGNELLYTVLTIQYTFYAEDGSFFEAVVTGEGMDSGDKSANKAMSVAQKYALLQVFCIPTEDAKDPENDNHDITPSKTSKNTTQKPPQPPDEGLNAEEIDRSFKDGVKADELIERIGEIKNKFEAENWKKKHRDTINGLIEAEKKRVVDSYNKKLEEVKESE